VDIYSCTEENCTPTAGEPAKIDSLRRQWLAQATSHRLWSVSIWLGSEESMGERVRLKLSVGGEEGGFGAHRERTSK
jgi:hypothetical protein